MTSEDIDCILIAWHRAQARAPIATGYPTECPSTRGYRSSAQWRGTDVDDDGDVYETAPDAYVAGVARTVDQIVNRMEQMHQIALAYQARALAIGSYAMRNPRLPSSADELSMLIADARQALVIALRMTDAGLFSEPV